MPILKVLAAPKGELTVQTDTGVFKRTGGTVSWRCQNPGNIKFGEFAKKFGAVGKDFGGHAVFPTIEDAKKAKYDLLFNEKTSRYYPLSLLEAMRIYAPVDDPDADNKPDAYAEWLADRVGINIKTKLSALSEIQRESLMDYISKYEGYKVGIISIVSGDEPAKPDTEEKKPVAIVNFNTEFQNFLIKNNMYDGPVDGKIGPDTKAAAAKLLQRRDIDTKGWSVQRKMNGAEQLMYTEANIDVGAIDGLAGPQLKHAREVFLAGLVTTWRDKVDTVEPPVTADVKVTATTMEWPLQRDCMTFYGKVGTNQDKCILPFEMVLAWDASSKLKSYSCHEKVKAPMERVWQRTFDTYGYEKIKDLGLNLFGGCLNVRQMRGGSAWSTHSWGIAVDIDPDRNELHTPWKKAQMSKPEYKKFVQFWYDEGAINLGLEADMDSMHMQFARLR